MDIKAIIFDLDGVLVFTDKFHFMAWKKIADELDIPFDEADNDRLRGVSRAESLEIILEKYKGEVLTEENKQELLEKKNSIYREYLGTMTKDDVSAEVRETLETLHKKGLKLAVGSSSKNTAYILEKTDMRDYFDGVADGTHIKRSKPDPEVFLRAAEFIDVEPSSCAVVEDADAGIEAANSAGMYSIAMGDSINNGIAKAHIKEFSQLLRFVD